MFAQKQVEMRLYSLAETMPVEFVTNFHGQFAPLNSDYFELETFPNHCIDAVFHSHKAYTILLRHYRQLFSIYEQTG